MRVCPSASPSASRLCHDASNERHRHDREGGEHDAQPGGEDAARTLAEDDGGDDQGKERAQHQVRHPDLGPRRDGGQRPPDHQRQQQAEQGDAADPQRRYGGTASRDPAEVSAGAAAPAGRKSIVCVSATPVAALL